MSGIGIDWDEAIDECVDHLRALIRIPSVNPPGLPTGAAGRDSIGGETAAASFCAEVLTAAGIPAEVIEPTPGRGSCFARLAAEGPNTEPPLILLSHLDVVPVEADAWSHDPFGAELVDGVVWGRGAVDMKDMVAMELAVMLALHRSGIDLKRDVIFAAVADEEAGGEFGALHWVRDRPQLFSDASGRPAAAALNEVGGYSITIGGRIKLAEAVGRLARRPRPARLIPVVQRFFEGLGLGEVAALAEQGADVEARDALVAEVEDPVLRRSLDAMLRDTVTPNVIHVGTKMNVVPGRGEAEVDVRTLPGTDQGAFLAELQAIAGEGVTVESVMTMPPVEWPADAEIVSLMDAALRRADSDATPLPMMITLGTDAKALGLLGIPTYGFAPLRLEPDVPYLSLFHATDERIPVSALRFGLPVLYEVVERFAAR